MLKISPGGISYFSAREGLVCDNVVNYVVVLASGEVANANARENTDLLLSSTIYSAFTITSIFATLCCIIPAQAVGGYNISCVLVDIYNSSIIAECTKADQTVAMASLSISIYVLAMIILGTLLCVFSIPPSIYQSSNIRIVGNQVSQNFAEG